MRKRNDLQMSPEALGFVAQRFKVLSEPLRLEILQHLEKGESSVSDITLAVESTQPNVSKHLRILQDGHLIARRQVGNTVYYRIADDSVFELCRLVCGSLREKFTRQGTIFS
jgi:DNA-binding transcriptional ArsR family regulator